VVDLHKPLAHITLMGVTGPVKAQGAHPRSVHVIPCMLRPEVTSSDQHQTTHRTTKHVPEFNTLMGQHQSTHHTTKHVPESNTLMDQHQTTHHTTKHVPEFNTLMDQHQTTHHTMYRSSTL
jgi:hypothetical protein